MYLEFGEKVTKELPTGGGHGFEGEEPGHYGRRGGGEMSRRRKNGILWVAIEVCPFGCMSKMEATSHGWTGQRTVYVHRGVVVVNEALETLT